MPNGEPRSYIDQLSVSEQEGRLALYLRVFTSKPCTATERAEYTRLVSARLEKPPQAVGLQLVEIPTASGELEVKAKEERRVEAPPAVAQLQSGFLRAIESSLDGLRLPPPAHLVGYKVMTSADEPLDITVTYLSDHEIDADAQALIVEDIKARLDVSTAKVKLSWIEESFGPLTFGRNQAITTPANAALLNRAGNALQQQPNMVIEINAGADRSERQEMAQERAQAIAAYLTSKWNIALEKTTLNSSIDLGRSAALKLKS
jgi:outer membrane protein OmpA-like peptidoglycan-associated protein